MGLTLPASPAYALRQTGLEEQEVNGQPVGHKAQLLDTLKVSSDSSTAGLEEMDSFPSLDILDGAMVTHPLDSGRPWDQGQELSEQQAQGIAGFIRGMIARGGVKKGSDMEQFLGGLIADSPAETGAQRIQRVFRHDSVRVLRALGSATTRADGSFGIAVASELMEAAVQAADGSRPERDGRVQRFTEVLLHEAGHVIDGTEGRLVSLIKKIDARQELRPYEKEMAKAHISEMSAFSESAEHMGGAYFDKGLSGAVVLRYGTDPAKAAILSTWAYSLDPGSNEVQGIRSGEHLQSSPHQAFLDSVGAALDAPGSLRPAAGLEEVLWPAAWRLYESLDMLQQRREFLVDQVNRSPSVRVSDASEVTEEVVGRLRAEMDDSYSYMSGIEAGRKIMELSAGEVAIHRMELAEALAEAGHKTGEEMEIQLDAQASAVEGFSPRFSDEAKEGLIQQALRLSASPETSPTARALLNRIKDDLDLVKKVVETGKPVLFLIDPEMVEGSFSEVLAVYGDIGRRFARIKGYPVIVVQRNSILELENFSTAMRGLQEMSPDVPLEKVPGMGPAVARQRFMEDMHGQGVEDLREHGWHIIELDYERGESRREPPPYIDRVTLEGVNPFQRDPYKPEARIPAEMLPAVLSRVLVHWRNAKGIYPEGSMTLRVDITPYLNLRGRISTDEVWQIMLQAA